MTTALATRQELLPSPERWNTMLNMADELVKSGLLPNAIKSPAAALAIIQTGQELGLPPMYALRKISVINGKPVIEAEVMLAMIYRDHGDNAVVVDETNEKRCVVRYKRKGWDKYLTFTWTIEEAKTAKLTTRDVWIAYPPAMLRARCISAMARVGFPDTIGGLYTAEEVGGEVEVRDGEIVVIDPPQATMTTAPTPIRQQLQAEVIQPTAPEEERARAMVQIDGEEITPRQIEEARYAALAENAIRAGHPKAKLIESVDVAGLKDTTLAKSIKSLEDWLLQNEPF